jgi:hypothetical protein
MFTEGSRSAIGLPMPEKPLPAQRSFSFGDELGEEWDRIVGSIILERAGQIVESRGVHSASSAAGAPGPATGGGKATKFLS